MRPTDWVERNRLKLQINASSLILGFRTTQVCLIIIVDELILNSKYYLWYLILKNSWSFSCPRVAQPILFQSRFNNQNRNLFSIHFFDFCSVFLIFISNLVPFLLFVVFPLTFPQMQFPIQIQANSNFKRTRVLSRPTTHAPVNCAVDTQLGRCYHHFPPSLRCRISPLALIIRPQLTMPNISSLGSVLIFLLWNGEGWACRRCQSNSKTGFRRGI